MKKMTKFEKEMRKELKKAKRKAMTDAFAEGMLYDFGEAVLTKPTKTILPMMGADIGIGIGIAALEVAKEIVIPKYVKYGISYAVAMALPVKYGITKAIEAGKRFDEMTTLRA